MLFSRTNRFVCALVLLVTPAATLFAREDRQIRWTPVKGAYGYVVQYRTGPDEEPQELRVTRSRANLRLPAGRYELRVAALNKFRKPSIWTPWTPVRLDHISAVVDLSRSQQAGEEVKNQEPEPEPEPKSDAESESPDGAESEAGRSNPEGAMDANDGESVDVGPGEDGQARRRPFGWFDLVPGVPQALRGQPVLGAGYGLLFAGMAGAGFGEWRAAETINARIANDPALLALAILPSPLELGLVLRDRRLADEAQFNRHRTNQQALGAAAALLYIVHLIDAATWRSHVRTEAVAPDGLDTDVSLAPEIDGADRIAGLRAGVVFRLRF